MKASNATFLDESTGGKGKYFRARILQAGLVKYSFGVCLLEKETIDKFIYEFVGCPVIIDHKDVTEENAKEERVGVISRVWFDQMDGWFWVEGVIFDEKAISLINDGYNVSCQYEISEYANNVTDKLHNGNKYDKVILNGKPEHLAIVKNPRYENAMIAVNALDFTAQNEDKWITIHPNGEDSKGRPLLLKDGETPKEAIDRVYKKNEQDNKKDDKAEKSKEENKDKYIGKKFFIGDREEEITEYLPQFDRYMGKNPEGLNWGATLYTKDDLDKYFIKSDEDYLMEKELREKQKVEREQTQKQKEEEERASQIEYMRDNGFTKGMTDLQKGKTLKDLNKEVWYKQINDGKPTTSKKMIEELIGKGFKPKEETFRTTKKINGERIDKDTASKILEDKDGNFYKLNSTEYKYAQYLQDKGKQSDGKAKNSIIQAINEIKETDMFKNLFKKKENNMDKDELKSLFMECLSELTASNSKEEEKEEKIEEKIEEKEEKVEDKAENSEDEEKEDEKEDVENKAKNEVVDKRDIIRQIMAIAGKHEDNEDVREIAKLAEKLAYEKSEADKKADNKCKNEEKEEEKEDKKASNSILEGQMAAGKVEFVPVDYNSRKSAIELGNELF